VEVVHQASAADLVVLHVIGRCEAVTGHAQELVDKGKDFAVIQYCLKSTQKPEVANWLQMWNSAIVVWSYYDLVTECLKERWAPGFQFYYAPLGAHSSVFYDRCNLNGTRPYLAMTHGQSWLTEGVREVVLATQQLNKVAFHVGSPVYRGEHLVHAQNISDDELATKYSQCQYVCPLRRTEGFELPAVEGLLCGARPVLYDQPHYRHWYGDYAEYIQELPRPEVLKQLVHLFDRPYRPVTHDEIATAREKFSWPKIIKGFWECVLN
jgi:hypothetical protein